MPKFDVFLSHNSVDKPWVVKLKDDLRRYGVSVWLDQDEIRPGDLFATALEEGLRNSQAIVLVISPEAMASGWVEEEYYWALALTKDPQAPKQLIPVILRDAKVPGFLQSRHQIDFRDKTAYAQNVGKLVWGITGQKPSQVLDLSAPAPRLPAPGWPSSEIEQHTGLTRDDIVDRLDQLADVLAQPDGRLCLAPNGPLEAAAGEQTPLLLPDNLLKAFQLLPQEANAPLDLRRRAYAAWLVTQRLTELSPPQEVAAREHYIPLAGRVGLQDLPLLNRRFAERRWVGEGPQRQVERIPLEDVTQAVDQHPAFLLLGPPGCGKSTVLRRLAWDTARAFLTRQGSRLPLWINLAKYDSQQTTPLKFVSQHWENEGLPGDFVSLARAGEMLLLADGLNEMDRLAMKNEREQQAKAWKEFIRQHFADPGDRSSRAVIASRDQADYDQPLDLPQVEIEPLSDDQIGAFLRAYLGEQADGALAALQRLELLEHARNPYQLYVLAALYDPQGGDLPPNRGRLFAEYALWLIKREERAGHPHWIRPEVQQAALSHLGYQMQAQSESTVLLADLSNPGLHRRARLQAGRVLGAVGNPRFTPRVIRGVEVILPDLVPVPAGTAAIGSARWPWDRQSDPDERPRHPVEVASFYLARFPVTHAEYACFIRAGGYNTERYWTPAGWQWRQGQLQASGPVEEWLEVRRYFLQNPGKIEKRLKEGRISPETADGWRALIRLPEEEARQQALQWYPTQPHERPSYWDDPAYHAPNQPVVGVTWYEAMAYCAWLQERLAVWGEPFSAGGDALDRLPAGGDWQVRLPTEAEWEWAAGGTRHARYPWRERFDADRANTLEGRVLGTSPVGAYPGGAAACGALDLSGNVWEWTHSLYQNYPYRSEDGREDPLAEGRRTFRGGSWRYGQRYARVSCRDHDRPDDFNVNIGFRVVVAPVLQ